MATIIGDQITLDGAFSDWLSQYMLANAANSVTGYQVYGALLDDATLGPTYVFGIDATGSTDPVIAVGTVIYLNTDQNDATGYSPFGNVGAEFEVQFALDSNNVLQPYLYSVTSGGATTLLNNGAPLDFGISSNGESLELAIPQSLITPSAGAAPTSINFSALINNGAVALPGDFTNDPEYVIKDASVAPTTIANTITLDGAFADWPAADNLVTPGNTVAGYQVYGALLNDATLGETYVLGIDATSAADPVLGAGTTIYLDTDQNTATGYSPFGAVGAEYEVVFNYGANSELEPFLYSLTSAGVATELNGDAPLPFGISANGESVELAIPKALLTPAGGAAPTSIAVAALINNSLALPGDFTADPQYDIVDTAALVPVNHAIKKVAIIFSATTAALFDGGGPAGESAYSDLFLAAQQEARAAGVSYDLLSESDLTDVAKLSQYSALIFPDFQNVQSSDAAAIANALYQVVYDYKVPIITSGDFMTDDQSGNPLPGDSYASMQSLLNLTSGGYGTATYSVTPDPAALSGGNPILAGYTSGQLIGGASGEFAGTTAGYYTNTGYLTFAGYTQPATTIADIDIQGGAALPGVVQTTTGGTNTDFATAGLFGDSNLLQHVIQNTVFGTTPSLSLDITRFKGIVNSRTDMDQSQFPTDVDPTMYDDQPAGTPGIYDELIPILQSLKSEYDFVGTYFINVGDDANTANDNFTNWSVSLPYYQDLLEMGNEIGDHSYTHLIDPPTTTVSETTTTATAVGATQIVVSQLPSYNGATLGMVVTDANNDFGLNTIITAYSGDAATGYTLTLSYLPGGYGTPDVGTVNAIASGSTITFGIPTENTNFLSTSGTGPFTYNYEFNQSAAIESANIGIPIAGAAVPGANDYIDDSLNILSAFPSENGLTGYVSGGWTGVGSGSPNAIGYITPSETSSVYIAPNITFDFSELQYEDKTPASSLADWETLFNELSANSETPIIVWPWHDYGITDWPTDGVGTTPPGYTEALYQDFIAYAYNAGDEFVTSEDLAQRVAAEQAATLSETTSGNVITASVTPSAAEPDLGAMALNVVNGAVGQVIQNAGTWYAYSTTSVFLADDAAENAAPETFTVTLGAVQDDVTHVTYLPMRADLQSVSGNGTNLTFSFTGDGTVDVHIKTPAAGDGVISIVQSIVGAEGVGALAPTATLIGDELQLTFDDGDDAISSTSPQGVPVEHTVTITEGQTAVAGASFVLSFVAGPTIASQIGAGSTASSAAEVTGTGDNAGDTITLYEGQTVVGTGTVNLSDAFDIKGVPIAGASVALTATETNSSGAASSASAPFTVFANPVLAATYAANVAALDLMSGGFAISDTAANVETEIAAIAADTHIQAIAVTGAGTVTISAGMSIPLPGGYSQTAGATDLSGAITGPVNVGGGTFTANSGASINGAVTIDGGTLTLNSGATVSGAMNFAGTGGAFDDAGAGAGNTYLITGAIGTANTATLAAHDSLTVQGVVGAGSAGSLTATLAADDSLILNNLARAGTTINATGGGDNLVLMGNFGGTIVLNPSAAGDHITLDGNANFGEIRKVDISGFGAGDVLDLANLKDAAGNSLNNWTTLSADLTQGVSGGSTVLSLHNGGSLTFDNQVDFTASEFVFTAALTQPTITSQVSTAATPNSVAEVIGKGAVAGDTITLVAGQTPVATGVVSASGGFDITGVPVVGGAAVLTATESNSFGSVSLASAPFPVFDYLVSTATYIANVATLDARQGGFAIADSAANVEANIGAIESDPAIKNITLTGAGTVTIPGDASLALPDGYTQTTGATDVLGHLTGPVTVGAGTLTLSSGGAIDGSLDIAGGGVTLDSGATIVGALSFSGTGGAFDDTATGNTYVITGAAGTTNTVTLAANDNMTVQSVPRAASGGALTASVASGDTLTLNNLVRQGTTITASGGDNNFLLTGNTGGTLALNPNATGDVITLDGNAIMGQIRDFDISGFGAGDAMNLTNLMDASGSLLNNWSTLSADLTKGMSDGSTTLNLYGGGALTFDGQVKFTSSQFSFA